MKVFNVEVLRFFEQQATIVNNISWKKKPFTLKIEYEFE